MTSRKNPILTDQIYHVFNCGIARQMTFSDKRDYQRFLSEVNYYRFQNPPIRFSFYYRLLPDKQINIMKSLQEEGKEQVLIYCFCLMSNHFHFLLKEIFPNGIRKFMGDIQNSYAKYFNTKNKRIGSLFKEMFRAVRIETDEQFLHVGRYVHLNPYSGYLVKKIEELEDYPWSSLQLYLGKKDIDFVETDFLSSFFRTKENLRSFIFDQADYQRKLQDIKHLIFE